MSNVFNVPENPRKEVRRRKRQKPPVSGEGTASNEDQAALAPFGVQTIEQFNQRIEKIEKAHRNAVGFRPTPGFAYDVSRAPIRETDYDELFSSRSSTGIVKRSASRLASADADRSFSEDAALRSMALEDEKAFQLQNTAREFVRGAPSERTPSVEDILAVRLFTENVLLPQSQQRVGGPSRTRRYLQETLMMSQQRVGGPLVEGIHKVVGLQGPTTLNEVIRLKSDLGRERADNLLNEIAQFAVDPAQVLAAADTLGLDQKDLTDAVIAEIIASNDPDEIAELLRLTGTEEVLLPGDVNGIVMRAGLVGSSLEPGGMFGLALRQIAEGIIYAPVGLAMLGQSIFKDQKDFFTTGKSGERTEELVETIVSTHEDMIKNPGAHPGDIFLTFFALASGGAGVAAKAGQVGRATAAGGVRAGGKALFTRIDPGSVAIGGAILNYSQNALWRAGQRARWEGVYGKTLPGTVARARRDATARRASRHMDAGDPETLIGIMDPDPKTPKARKIGRERKREAIIERDLREVPVRLLSQEMAKAQKAARIQERVFREAAKNPLLDPDKLISPTGKLSRRNRRAGLAKLTEVAGYGYERTAVGLLEGIAQLRIVHQYFLDHAEWVAKAMKEPADLVRANHRSQLAILNAAEKTLDDVEFPKIERMIHRANQLSDETTSTKLGLGVLDDAAMAAERAARPGAFIQTVVRGKEAGAGPNDLMAVWDDVRPLSFTHEDGIGVPMPHNDIGDPTAFYIKAERASLAKGKSRGQIQADKKLTGSPIFQPDVQARMGKQYEYKAWTIVAGDQRVDTPELLIDDYRRTASVVDAVDEHAAALRLVEEGVWGSTKRRQGYIPVLKDTARATDEKTKAALSKIIDDEYVGLDDVGLFDEARNLELRQSLFPGMDRDGRLAAGVSLDDVAWVDPNALIWNPLGLSGWDTALRAKLAGGPLSAQDLLIMFNSPIRDLTLYARLGYILNWGGAGMMQLIHQGPLAFHNYGRAVMLRRLYAKNDLEANEFQGVIRALHGETRTQSYLLDVPRDANGLAAIIAAPGQAAARFWNQVTDLHWRDAAVIHELNVKGIDIDNPAVRKAMIKASRARRGTPEANKPAGIQIAGKDATIGQLKSEMLSAGKRAKRSSIEFDNLGPFERTVMRHLFFIYAFTSRSSLWTVNALLDHPIKFAAGHYLGVAGKEEVDEILGDRPQWMDRLPLLPVGTNDLGQPKTINLAWANTAGILGDMAFIGLAQAYDSISYADVIENLNPAAAALAKGIVGRGDFGQETTFIEAFQDELFKTVPSAAIARRALRKREQDEEGPLPDQPISDPRGLIRRRGVARSRSVTQINGVAEVIAPIASSAAFPIAQDPEVAAAQAYSDKTPEEKVKEDMRLIRQRLRQQSQILRTPVPVDVQRALEFSEWIAAELTAWEKEGNPELRSAGTAMRTQFLIDKALEGEFIDDGEAEELTAERAKAKSPVEFEEIAEKVRVAAGKNEVARWVHAVQTVEQFRERVGQNPGVLPEVVSNMKDEGLGDFSAVLNAPDDIRDEYGRRYLSWYREQRVYSNPSDEVLDFETDDETAARLQALRDLLDERDEPITIKGHTFPAPLRVQWAKKSRAEREAHRNGLLNDDWADMSRFEKELLGKKVSPDVQAEWRSWRNAVDAANDELARAGRDRLSRKQQADLAALGSDEFKEDYRFARLTSRFERFQSLKPFLEHRGVWESLTDRNGDNVWDRAKLIDEALAQPLPADKRSSLLSLWKTYVDTDVTPALRHRALRGDPAVQPIGDAGGSEFIEGWFSGR